MNKNIELIETKKSDPRLLDRMINHYSKPKGFVGRSICYAIICDNKYYGHIVGGSATLHLPNRNNFFSIDNSKLNNIVNNVFFNVTPINNKYPCRNFTSVVVSIFMEKIKKDWMNRYNDEVIGFETLVEPPRTGELYKKIGWVVIGVTKGMTCKRVAGKNTEKWGGVRVWNKDKLRPKLVLCYKMNYKEK